ncbi:SDR family oxidoreductase [Sphingobium sp. JS3065]|uniref:SDR family NAD(P)-dependent oxidoreductase n=1 Tax=Sphingobium sp. JS3065 TaxID=2970925 RepID=UPI0022644F12|nr:SDR family oxidoreductase [Sphingobium sp. JS3065]UZW57067.1 SDR family oxidoreductase [Sphingobium sp. JS3065]
MKPYFDFTDRVVVVTGGSRGLGAALCRAFAEHGADVVIASRKLENCEKLAREIEANTGRRALPIAVHAGNWADLERLVETVYAEFGRIDVLINNAGMSPIASSSVDTPEGLFDKVIDVNFKGPFRLTALVGSRMAARDGGAIINITSIGAIRPQPAYGPYAGAKAALNAVTEAFAHEYAPKVRVNAIMPGSFRTDIAKSWDPSKEASTPAALKRFGEPEEIVGTVMYLAGDASSFTTGAVIRVDGGRP